MTPNLANPERLLLALEGGLDHQVQLIIYGRSITEEQLLAVLPQMKPIELVELRDAFTRAKPRIMETARAAREH